MNTKIFRRAKNPSVPIDPIPIFLIVLAFVVSMGVTGCFDSSSEEAPPALSDNSKTDGTNTSSLGETLYTDNCVACHGANGSGLNDKSVNGITTAMDRIGSMNGMSFTSEEIQAISDYLTGNTGGGSGGGAVDGQALYADNCSGCHGSDGSTLSGRTAAQIAAAIVNVSTMTGVSLSGTEIQAIAAFLGDGSGDGGSGGPPASHTNSEDGVMHMPGNLLPYTNGCTMCHGPALEGGVAPSCTGCHGEVWNESPPTGGGNTGGGGSSEGQALYTANCAACHGTTGTSLAGRTVDQIASAISNVTTMNNIALSLTETQAIADYLAGVADGGNTGGGNTGGGNTGGGGGSTDGLTLYTDNCSGCHGADGATINDPSVNGITTAISNIGSMSNVSLTTAEIQAISDYLTTGTGGGNTGGGDTGGGGTSGGLPPNHTNSEEGVLHADGNNYPYTNGCTACHGATLGGGAGPSCTACHGVEWNENPPTGGGDTGSGSTDGQALYTANCSGCHGANGANINDPSASGITAAMSSIGSMSNVALTAAEIQAISDYITGGTGGGNTGGGNTGGSTDGQALYSANCSACHGADGAGLNDPSVSGITTAISNINSMSNVSLTAAEIQAISDYITGGTGGGNTGGGDPGGLPANHTNAEDGILHAPGNNYPYTNGCTSCHGASLQGAAGPSCYACHGEEWSENPPSGDGGSSGGGGSTAEGQTLYTSNCSGCHGATGSNINGRSASAISTAIASIGSMNNISLTSAEIQAIADYLMGSTGGGSGTGGGGSGTGGLPANHTNSEEGALHAPGNNYPYTNGCTSCHGVNLQGGMGPSCYSCHGQEWSGSNSGSGGGSGGDGDGRGDD